MDYRLAPRADNDLDEIWSYIAQDNPSAADRFIDSLGEKFAMLAAHPHAGRPSDALRPGLRRLSFGNYAIFYRIESNCVEIARILHGARDIEEIFEPREEA
jgi:toxin ParE1/3/4